MAVCVGYTDTDIEAVLCGVVLDAPPPGEAGVVEA